MRLVRILAVSACAAVVLAACGDDESTATAPAQSGAGTAQSGGDLELRKVGTFDQPLYVTGAPGDTRRLYVVEQPGRIMVVRGGRKLTTPFLDIRSKVRSGGEQGLLSVAFPKNHQKTGLFYVYYTDKRGDNRVVEYRRARADRANRSTARLVLKMDSPEPNHNGGLLKFGPRGRLLYIGTGDGGGGNDQHGERGNAQDLGSLLGKILRIDPRKTDSRRYRVPEANPFTDRRGARDEIYSYGLRNPWRFSFDRKTGDLAIGDVGQSAVEEIDFVRKHDGKGANFGWRPFEGSKRNFDEPAPGHVPPVIEKSHDDGWCSITGGYVVRDESLPRSLRGDYVYGDFCQGRIRAARLTARGARDDRQLPLPKVGSLSSFGEDTRGRIYVVSLDGTVSRLAAK